MWCKSKDFEKIISRIKLYIQISRKYKTTSSVYKNNTKYFTGAVQTKKCKRTDRNFIHSTLSHRHMNTDDYGHSPSIQVHGRENNLISPRTMFTVSHRMPSSWWTGNKTLPCRLSTHVLPHSTRPKGGFSSRVAHQMTTALDEVARSPVSLSAVKVNESQSICAEPGSTLHYLGETPSMSAKARPDTVTNKRASVSLGAKTK